MSKTLEYALLFGSLLLSIIIACVMVLLYLSEPTGPSAALIVFLIIGAIAFIIGIMLIVAYFTSKNVFFLVLGCILTLVIPGVCLFLGYKKWSESQVMCYVMVPVETSAPNGSEKLQEYRKTAITNSKCSLPDDVVESLEKSKN